MELRAWAFAILSGSTLEEKLFDPGLVTDLYPGPAYFFDEPAREKQLEFKRRSPKNRLPAFQEHGKESARLSCLHRFCGHELLAVELLAFAALAYPEAPKGYRQSLIHHLRQEQSHVVLYRNRLLLLGSDLGQEPLYRHFWASSGYLHTLDSFISYMNLTLEQANLDFAPMYLASFARHGDFESAQIMAQILTDEVSHVKLGLHWLGRLHPTLNEDSLFDQWKSSLPHSVRPEHAMGFLCHRSPREAASIPSSWIDRLCPIRSKQIQLPMERLLSKN